MWLVTRAVKLLTRTDSRTRDILGQAHRVRLPQCEGHIAERVYVIDLTAGRDCRSPPGVHRRITAFNLRKSSARFMYEKRRRARVDRLVRATSARLLVISQVEAERRFREEMLSRAAPSKPVKKAKRKVVLPSMMDELDGPVVFEKKRLVADNYLDKYRSGASGSSPIAGEIMQEIPRPSQPWNPPAQKVTALPKVYTDHQSVFSSTIPTPGRTDNYTSSTVILSKGKLKLAKESSSSTASEEHTPQQKEMFGRLIPGKSSRWVDKRDVATGRDKTILRSDETKPTPGPSAPPAAEVFLRRDAKKPPGFGPNNQAKFTSCKNCKKVVKNLKAMKCIHCRKDWK